MSEPTQSIPLDYELQKRHKAGLGIVLCLLLLPIIFNGIFLDNTIFARGARVLIDGGKLYTQYLDIKPPLIFYVYLIPEFLFPSSEIALRSFDLLYQLIVVFSIIYVVRRILRDERIAYVSALLYVITYSVIHYVAALQCETMAALPLLWILFFENDRAYAGTLKGWLGTGFLVGICFSLKYTLGIIFIALVVHDLIYNRLLFKDILKKYAVVSIGIFITIGIIFLPFIVDNSVWQAYSRIINYTTRYASFPPMNGQFLTRVYEKQFELFFNYYSVPFVALVTVGIGAALTGNSFKDNRKSLLTLSFIIAVLLWVSVIIEKKFFLNHFVRMYLPLAILGGAGAIPIFKTVSAWWGKGGKPVRRFILGVGIVLLLISPFYRLILMMRLPYFYFSKTHDYNASAPPGTPLDERQQQQAVAHRITAKRKIGERVFSIGLEASHIAYYLHEKSISKFSTSQFYLGKGVPDIWKKEAFSEIEHSSWVVIQTDDHWPDIYGSPLSSWESIQKDTAFSELIHSKFLPDTTIGSYHIFKKL